jgi:thiol reductant ABC exporter CydD subunit
VLALTVPMVPLFMVLVGKMSAFSTRRRFTTLSLLGAHFLDVVRGLPTLRAYRREHAQEEALATVGDRYRRETMATLRVAFLSALVLELIAMLGVAIVAATVGIQLANGTLQLEAGLAVLILAPELYAPLRRLGAEYHASEDGLVAAERLFELAEAPAALTRPQHPLPAPDPAMQPLRVEGVRFAHPDRGGDVLAGVDLELAPGTTTALVGPSGAGKSTLAALILRLADPATGRIRCGDVDLAEVAPESWWEQVAWLPQRSQLFAGSVADNIRLGDAGASETEVRGAARDAGVLDAVDALPQGLDTVVGEGGRGLSAGQAQRIALARVFLKDAGLVVLDEPTAHLDPATAAVVAAGIDRLARGRTVLLVVHDRALAAHADRIVELADGRALDRHAAARGPLSEVAA